MPTPPRLERRLFAIGLRLLAMLALAVMFVSVKLLAEHHVHIVEQLFYRQFIALPIVFAFIAATQGPRAVATRRIGKHGSRAILGMIGMICNFAAYILLTPVMATAIGFTMPIFGTILSALILREATGWHRWCAVLVGFTGVLVVAHPDGALPPLGAAVALIAAILTAFISLLLRDLGRTEGAGTTVFWFTLLSVPPLAFAMLFFARTHDPVTWALIAVMGVSGGIAQLCMTGALRWGPVSVVLPMDYSIIVWTTLFGWLIWGDLPTSAIWVGAALIILSGLYIAWREHIRGQWIQTPVTVAVE